MDEEAVQMIKDIEVHHKELVQNLTNIQLNRARGHNHILSMGYQENSIFKERGYPHQWDLAQRLDELFDTLRTSGVVSEAEGIGRLQAVEAELMKYKRLMGNLEEAATISIRMILEDPYVSADAAETCIQILLEYVDSSNEYNDTERAKVREKLFGCAREIDCQLMEHYSFEGTQSAHTTEGPFTNMDCVRSRSGRIGCTMESF